MTIQEQFSSVSNKTWICLFLGIFILSACGAYFFREDSVSLDGKILSKRRDLSAILDLARAYRSKKDPAGVSSATSREREVLLAEIERIALKSLVTGKVMALRYSTMGDDRSKNEDVVEVKAGSVPLAEVIAFMKNSEAPGFKARKFHLAPSSSSGFELSVLLGEGRR